MTELTSYLFLGLLQKCIREYKKQMLDTRDDNDAAHFFNSGLKTFLESHKKELDILSTLNFEKQFMSWVKNYLLK